MATLDVASDVDIIFTPEQLFSFSRKFYPLEFSLVVTNPSVAFCVRKDLLHRLDRRLVEAITSPEQVVFSNDAFFVACRDPSKAIKWHYYEESRYRDFMNKRESMLANAQGRNATPYWRVDRGTEQFRVLIVGATNMGNIGDDMIAKCIGSWMREIRPDCTLHFSDFRISRPDLADFDLIVVGGGGIVYVSQFGQNETDNLANYFKIPIWAREFAIPCIVLGVGVQGHRDQFSRDPLVKQFLTRSLRSASDIIVRDQSSRDVLGELSGYSISVLPDVAFSVGLQHSHYREARPTGSASSVTFIGEVVAGRVAFFATVLEKAPQDIAKVLYGVTVSYFVMSNDDIAHRDRLLQLLTPQGITCTVVDLRKLSTLEVLETFRSVSTVVTARLHGLVMAILAGTPALSVDLSIGKQSALISDFFPSAAGSVVQEACSRERILEKLSLLIAKPYLFSPDVVDIEAVINGTRAYTEKLRKWMFKSAGLGSDFACKASGQLSSPRDDAVSPEIQEPFDDPTPGHRITADVPRMAQIQTRLSAQESNHRLKKVR